MHVNLQAANSRVADATILRQEDNSALLRAICVKKIRSSTIKRFSSTPSGEKYIQATPRNSPDRRQLGAYLCTAEDVRRHR
jgi:hypothetical protein